jgi:hypothetical protein
LFIKKPTAKNKNKKIQKEVPVNDSPSYDNEELPTMGHLPEELEKLLNGEDTEE